MDRDSDDEEEEDEEEEDDEKEDEEEEEENGDEEEDKDEDEGKEPRTIGQGDMLITSADHVHTLAGNQPTVLPEQGQEMHKRTPRPHPLAPTPRQPTLLCRPQRQTLETHPLCCLEYSGLVTLQRPRPALPTLQEVEAARNTSDMDVDQQLRMESAGGNSLANVPFPDVTLPQVRLPDVPFPGVPLPDVPLPEARPDRSVGKQ